MSELALCINILNCVLTQADRDVRHIIFWRYFSLGFSGTVCLLLGGIVSEFVQSMLPVCQLQHFLLPKSNLLGSIRRFNGETLSYVRHFRAQPPMLTYSQANLLGASLGLLVAYRLERYYRFRREVARLYQPLGESEAEEESGEELLPTHNASKTAKLAPTSNLNHPRKNPRLGNVWDSREDFDIGSASEDEDEGLEGRRKPTEPFTPQIVVSHST